MKICIIPPDKEEPHLLHISSGQERVARDQATVLARAGHEVDYWTVNTKNDLSPLGFNHRVMHDIEPRTFFNSNRPNPQTKKKKNWCDKYADQYDIFICHTDSSVFLKELVRRGAGTRIISFLHCHFAGTMWGIGFNSGQGRVRWGGGTVVAVAERTKNHWNKWSASTLKRLRSPNPGKISRPDLLNSDVTHEEFVTEVFCPQYSILDSEVQPASIGPVVLSRLAPEKKIHNAFGVGATFILRSDSKKYHVKIKDKLEKEEHYIDLPYEDCMDWLTNASYLISTWTEEASPLAVFEATERGVPVIFCEKGAPAGAREYLPDFGYLVAEDNAKGIHDAISRIPPEWNTLEFRQKLAATTRSSFSAAEYNKRLFSLVEIVYNRTKDTPLEPKPFGASMSKTKRKRKFAATWASVTTIGKRFGISGIKVNKILEANGLRDTITKVPVPKALSEGYAIATPLKDGTPHFMWNNDKVFNLLSKDHSALHPKEVAFEKFLKDILGLERETMDLGTDKPLWWYIDAELPTVCDTSPEVIEATCVRVGVKHRTAEFQKLVKKAQEGRRCLS